MNQSSFDTFYLKHLVATLLPASLAAIALPIELFVAVAFIRGGHTHPRPLLVSSLAGLFVLVLAWCCRVFARHDNLLGAMTATYAFGGTTTALGALVGREHGQGAVSIEPVVTMFAVVGAVIAQRYWHVVVGWVVVVGPMLWIASFKPLTASQQSYLGRYCVEVIAFTTLVYAASMRVKRGYYGLYCRLDHESRHDGLTGLLNRRAWMKEVDLALGHLSANEGAIVVYLDVDAFKSVNDESGHADGDRVLICLARALRATFGSSAVIGRMGGDEFVMLVAPASRLPDGAVHRIERGLKEVRGAMRPITISAGGAFIGHRDRVDLALRSADAALIRAKYEGRDRFAIAMNGDSWVADVIEMG